jgi:hypothetical protein
VVANVPEPYRLDDLEVMRLPDYVAEVVQRARR